MKKIFYILFLCLFSCNQEKDIKESETIESDKLDASKLATDSVKIIQAKSNQPQLTTWTFDKIENKKLLFKEGHSFDTELYNLEYIGQVATDNKEPFLIYSGRDCDECDANISIYFHTPRNGKLKVGNGENSYSYPGKETDYINNSLIYQARAFYGEVLKGVFGVIWYQKTLQDNNTFKNTVYLAKVEGDSIKNQELKGYDNLLKETQSFNKTGKNKEIKGIEYTSEP